MNSRTLRLLTVPLFALAMAKGAELPFSYLRGGPLRIGHQVQFLMDDYMVEDRWKLTRRVGTVVKHLRNPVLIQDQPWEGEVGGYPCVLFDPKLGKYRMWNQCFNLTNYFSREGPVYYVGYAESDDGFNWTKPRLEGFPFGGFPRTNIVTAGRTGRWAGGFQVLFNPDQSDPEKRMMMAYVGQHSIDLAYSPDGLHWKVREQPLLPYHSDVANHLVWIPERQLWFLYVRPNILPNGWSAPRITHLIPLPEGLRHTGRRLAVSTSADLENWTVPRTILYADELDPPDYDNVYVFRRHDLFLGLYAEMFQDQGEAETEVYVATSRDGIRWDRTWDRKPFIPRGPAGSFDHGQTESGCSPPLEIGEDMLFYYSASPVGQGEMDAECGVGVCRLRRDRFVGQSAGEQTGFLLTRQFVLDGSALKINCSALPRPYLQASDGIRVAIIAAPDFKTKETTWETAIPGFSLADCDPIVTDNIAHTVTWKGGSDLSRLKGRAVYLRFEMKHADLYTFQIAP